MKDRKIKIAKELEKLFTNPVPLPRPEKVFCEKLTHLRRPRNLTHISFNIFSADMDRLEKGEMVKKTALMKKYLLWLAGYLFSKTYKKTVR